MFLQELGNAIFGADVIIEPPTRTRMIMDGLWFWGGVGLMNKESCAILYIFAGEIMDYKESKMEFEKGV